MSDDARALGSSRKSSKDGLSRLLCCLIIYYDVYERTCSDEECAQVKAAAWSCLNYSEDLSYLRKDLVVMIAMWEDH